MKFQNLFFKLFIVLLLCSNCSNDDGSNNANLEPVATDQSFNVDEGVLNLTEIGQVMATDPQNSNLTYLLVSESVSGAFNLDGATGMLSVNEEFPFDYEVNNTITAIVKIENEAQLSTEITVNVNITDLEYPNTGLRAFYKFDELTNSIAIDETNNYNGEIINSINLVADRNGNNNSAYNFSGGRVRVAPDVLNGLTNYTIMGWLRTNTLSGGKSIFVKGTDNDTDIQFVQTAPGLSLRYRINGGSYYISNDPTNAALTTNVWTHFAVKVENGTNWSLFINGQLVGSEIHSTSNNWTSHNLNIGAFGSVQEWDGDMDDFMIYDRALRNVEITNLATDSY